MGYSIQTFHTGFLVCLTVMIVALVLAAVMFFVFDIRTIYAIRSGRAQRRDIEKNKEQNLKTDQLGRKKFFMGTGSLGKTGQTKGNTGRTGSSQAPAAPAAAAPEAADTAALNSQDADATSVLKAAPQTGEQVPQAPVGFRFVVTENTLVIHTQESVI